MRKRWSVMIVGDSGLAASHRAEMGRHRSEAAARRAAEAEWQRLVATRGGSAHGYRVVLEHDGEEVPYERPLARPEPPAPAPPSPPPVPPLVPALVLASANRNGANGDGAGGGDADGHGDVEGHGDAPATPERDRGRGRERPARPEIPEPPPGPVPEEILARWAREEPARRER